MILHLLKDPVSPLALQLLSSQTAAQANPSVVVLLSSIGALPALPKCTVYRVTENALAQSNDTLSYDRLVDLVFEADRVLTW